jgi:hypothetical protein
MMRLRVQVDRASLQLINSQYIKVFLARENLLRISINGQWDAASREEVRGYTQLCKLCPSVSMYMHVIAMLRPSPCEHSDQLHVCAYSQTKKSMLEGCNQFMRMYEDAAADNYKALANDPDFMMGEKVQQAV